MSDLEEYKQLLFLHLNLKPFFDRWGLLMKTVYVRITVQKHTVCLRINNNPVHIRNNPG